MKKHCMLLRKTSGSVFLKDVAQTKMISLLFPEYTLVHSPPSDCQHLLLLDTVVNPVQLQEDYTWVRSVPCVEVLPELKKPWEKLLKRTVKEVSL